MNNKVLEATASKSAEPSSFSSPLPSPSSGEATASASGGGGLANASKEELIDVLKKMNTRVKGLTALREKLTERAEAAEKSNQRIIAFLKEELLKENPNYTMNENQPEMDQLLDAWKQKDQLNRQALEALRGEMKQLQQQGNNGSTNGTSSSAIGGADVAALREQFKEEQERAMAALRDFLTKQHAKEVGLLKAQFQQQTAGGSNSGEAAAPSPVTTPGGSGSSEVEELKAKHAEEIQKFKQAAAVQLQNFKKKVATARAAEIEKIKKTSEEEAKAKFDEELQKVQASSSSSSSGPSQADVERVEQELTQKHAAELQRVKMELQQGHSQELERIKSTVMAGQSNETQQLQKQHEAQIQMIRQEAEAKQATELERVRNEVSQEFEAKRQAEVEKASTTMTAQSIKYEEEMTRLKQSAGQQIRDLNAKLASAVESYKAQQEALAQQHAAKLQALQADLESKGAAREEQVRLQTATEVTRQVQEKIMADSQGLSQQKDAEMAKFREMFAMKFDEERKKMLEAKKAGEERVRAELTKAANDQLEQLKTTSAAEREQLLAHSKHEMEATVQRITLELQQKQTEELNSARSAVQAGQSEEVQRLKQQFAAQAKQFQETSAKKQADEVERVRQELLGLQSKELEAQIGKVTSQHQGEILKLKAQFEQEALEEKTRLEGTLAQLQKDKDEQQTKFESLKKELEAEAAARVEEAKTISSKEVQEKAIADLAAFATQKDNEVKMLQTQFAAQQEAEKKALKEAHAVEQEKLRSELEKEQSDSVQALQTRIEKEKEATVAAATQDLENKLQVLKIELDQAKNAELQQVKQEALLALQKVSEESKAREAQRLTEVRNEMEQKLKEAQEAMIKSSNELQTIAQKEQALQGQVQELTSRLAAATDEKEAILQSSKQGEDSSKSVIEESLSKQRESYEGMMKDQKDRHAEELNVLQSKICGLEEISQKSNELTALQARQQQTIADLTETLKEKEPQLEQQVSSASEASNNCTTLQTKINELQLNMAKLQQENDATSSKSANFLQELQGEKEQLAAQKSKLEATISEAAAKLRGKDEELEKMSLKSDQLVTLHADHEKKISELTKQLTDKENQLVKQSSSTEQASTGYSTLQAQYDELQRATASLKQDYDTKSSQSETDLKNLLAAKEQLVAHKTKLESTLAEVTTELKIKGSKLEETEVTLQKAGEDYSSLREQFEGLQKECAELRVTGDASVSETANTVQSLQEESMKLAEELEQVKKTLQDGALSTAAMGEVERGLKAELEKLNVELQTVRSTLDESRKAHAGERGKSSDKITKLHKELEQAETTIATVKKENEDFMNEIREGNKSVSAAVSENIEKLETALAQKSQELVELKSRQDLQLTELMDKQSSLQVQNGELEARAKQRAEEVEQLKTKMANYVDEMKAKFQQKISAEREKSDAAEVKDKKREEQLGKFAANLKTVTEALKKEREEKAELQNKLKAEATSRQQIAKQAEALKKNLDDSVSNSESATSSLISEQEALHKSKEALQKELQKMKAERDAFRTKVEELGGKLGALERNVNSMAEDIKKKDEVLQQAEKHRLKLNSSENEVTDLRQQINKLKLEGTKNSQLLARLQADKDVNERNHGQRTALMGMLETQLAEMNEKNSDMNAKLEAALYDLRQKDEVVANLEEKIKEMEQKVTEAEKEKKDASEALASSQKGAAKKSTMMVDSLQRELQQVQQAAARKSAAAQKIIQEKEAECSELRAANKELQQEVDKGSLSDRKIFELAELQSNRESAQVSEIEIRDGALERLKTALLIRDGDLAHAEKVVEDFRGQIDDLCRIKRREDVNMDYLKGIVVQYLSKPPGSSERSSLLPVLATLLQVSKCTLCVKFISMSHC
jgi:chromosome segregation ATPase